MVYSTKIRAIGNSRGVIIPQDFALEVGTEYTVRELKGNIVLSPKVPDIYEDQKDFSLYMEEEWKDDFSAGKEKI